MVIDFLGVILGIIFAVIMFIVYFYNICFSKKFNFKVLKAAVKDNFFDVVILFGMIIVIFVSSFNYFIVDKLVVIIIIFFILKIVYDIFIEFFFSFLDGFDDCLFEDY